MKLTPRHLLLTVLAALVLSSAGEAKPTKEEGQFRQWLIRWFSEQKWSEDQDLVYGYALVDLNGDGHREAIVWPSAPGICGSGGCDLKIFANGKAGWKLVSSTAVTRPPIRVLESKTKGWHDLGVIEASGGIEHPYEGRLQFDGKRYNAGWTANKVTKGAKGRVVIWGATIPL